MDTSQTAEFDQPKTITASIILAISGWMVFMGMPILVGALADLRGYSEEAVGYLASAELGGMFLSSVFVSVMVKRLNLRLTAIIGLLISLSINLLSTQVEAYGPFMLLRFVAGFGSGMCYSIAIANLSGSQFRARNFSYLIFVLVLVNAVELYTFPQLAAAWGVSAIFIAFASLNAVSLLITPVLPRTPADDTIAEEAPQSRSPGEVTVPPEQAKRLAWLCLIAITAFYVCIGGFWAYIERLGSDRGLSSEFIGTTLAVTTVFSLIGCFGAYWLSKRAGQSIPLVIAFGAIGLVVFLMGLITTPLIYVAGLVGFQLLWNAADIYQLGTLSNIDRVGRYGALVPGAQGLGQTIGPAGGGFLLGQGAGYVGVMSFVGVMAILAMTVYFIVHLMTSRAHNVSTSSAAE